MKKKSKYRTSQKLAVAKRCRALCRYELFRRFESATKPLFSSLALRSGVTRRCVSMTTSVSLDRVSCPKGFLPDRERLKKRRRERERARVEIDRSVCQQTERQPIRREDLTCNRPNSLRRFGRNSAARRLTLPLSVFYFSRCRDDNRGEDACTCSTARGWQLAVMIIYFCAIHNKYLMCVKFPQVFAVGKKIFNATKENI